MEKINKIAGVDEVGRGCLAGPVVADDVCMSTEFDEDIDLRIINMIKDSKQMSKKNRNICHGTECRCASLR